MDCVFWSSFDRIIFYVKKIRINRIMKKLKIKNKAGELTTQQLVTIIILIVSFAVLLILLFKLNLGETTDKEICHNSVLMKSKGKGLIGELDCKTNYICISGGGECKDFNPTTTVKVNPKNKSEIIKEIADEMADCWWMFGECKLDYGNFWDLKGYHCAICSIIKFDNKIQENFPEISYTEFYNYLNKPKDKTQTYLKYLYGTSSLNELEQKFEGPILTSEKYAVFTGMNPGAGKDPCIMSQIIKSENIGDKEKSGCDVFDITKA